MKNNTQVSETYKISTYGFCVNLSIIFLISLVISIIPLLLSREDAVFYSSQPFFIAVLLLFVGIMYYRWYGIMLAIFTFAICGVIYRQDPIMTFMNSMVNVIQIVILLLSYLGFKRIKTKNLNLYSKGVFFVSLYNFVLILLFIGYIVYCTSFKENIISMLEKFSAIVFVLTIIKVISARDIRLLYFTFLIALFPSVIASLLSSIINQVSSETRLDYIITWSLSNYVLLQTAGYLLCQIFFNREIKMLINTKIINLDANSIIFYISTIMWNLLILWMMNNEIIKVNSSIYFFPWALGNIFLIMNLYFSSFYDSEAENDKFAWYEKRVITVEKTQYLLSH